MRTDSCWSINMRRTNGSCSKNCGDAWKIRGFPRRNFSFRRRSSCLRVTGLDRTEHVDLSENGNRDRKLWTEHIQDRQSARISERDRQRAVYVDGDRQFEKCERSQLAAAAGRRNDCENGVPSCGESQRSVALPRGGETDPGFARLRLALLLSARPTDHDPNLACGIGKEIRPQSLKKLKC